MIEKPDIFSCIKKFAETGLGKIFRCAFKFYFVYYIIALLIAVMHTIYVKWTLSKMSARAVDGSYKVPDVDIDKVYSDLWAIMGWMYLIPVVLALFSVFFTRPPKAFTHVLALAFLVSCIGNLNIFISPTFYDFLGWVMFFLGALLMWGFSCGWYKMVGKLKLQAQLRLANK